jgi:putative ABC transport system substrate-binding protein
VNVSDPIGSGFVASLSRPGGNITGFLTFEFSIGGKWLELLKEVAPRVNRAASMFNPNTGPFFEALQGCSRVPGHVTDRSAGS